MPKAAATERHTEPASPLSDIEAAGMRIIGETANVDDHIAFSAAFPTDQMHREELRRLRQVAKFLPDAGTAAELASLERHASDLEKSNGSQITKLRDALAAEIERVHGLIAKLDAETNTAKARAAWMRTARAALRENAPGPVCRAHSTAKKQFNASPLAVEFRRLEGEIRKRREFIALHDAGQFDPNSPIFVRPYREDGTPMKSPAEAGTVADQYRKELIGLEAEMQKLRGKYQPELDRVDSLLDHYTKG
jgi:hypothetical protein